MNYQKINNILDCFYIIGIPVIFIIISFFIESIVFAIVSYSYFIIICYWIINKKTEENKKDKFNLFTYIEYSDLDSDLMKKYEYELKYIKGDKNEL